MVAYLNLCKRLIARNGYLRFVSLNLIIRDDLEKYILFYGTGLGLYNIFGLRTY